MSRQGGLALVVAHQELKLSCGIRRLELNSCVGAGQAFVLDRAP
jgi:hypothetical protein